MVIDSRIVWAIVAHVVAGTAWAQAPAKAPQQVVKPPVAQAWIDVATYAGMGMPGMGMSGMGAGGAPMGMLGGMLGGGQGSGKNSFGNTQTGPAGRWMDVTLHTSRNPSLQEATQAVPEGTRLAPTLKLVSPQEQKSPPPPPGDDTVTEPQYERPRGKLYLYWGCGETVRPGQPRVLDMATAAPADFQQFFAGRRATQHGAHSAVGRPQWPNRVDDRLVPDRNSLVGEHAFTGQGVPEGFRFTLPAAQDIMPAIELTQRNADGATQLEWATLPTARAYFIAAMGARGENEMVFWSSSELPEPGTGLVDYQTNSAVDRWLREKVLLEPGTTRCAVPKGAFGEGAMLRMIAYGSELNVVHPPRPADPKVAWEPQWAAKVRVKSVASAMLGMDMAGTSRGTPRGSAPVPGAPAPRTSPPEPKEPEKPINPVDVLRGIIKF
jgi:hypothetical protein